MLSDEAIDRGLQIGDRAEHAIFNPPPCQLGEEAFDGVEPGARGGREVERPARVAREPSADFFMFMGGIVVEDSVGDLASGNHSLNRVQEADELLMPVALHVLSDHRAVENVKRREQRGRAVARVVMDGRPAPTLLEGQARLAWRPNLGRRSTYLSGKSVRTTGATSMFHAAFAACWLELSLGSLYVTRRLSLACPRSLNQARNKSEPYTFIFRWNRAVI